MRPLRDTAEIEPPLRVVRSATAHDSAIRHVSGAATYVDDIREPEGTLHIAPGGAPVARGKLKSVDLDAVRGAPGVVLVLTAADIPGENNVGPVKHDDPIFAEEMIEFHNQVVFAVVAETREAARRAVRFAKIEVESESPLVTVDDALAADTHVLPDSVFETGDTPAALAGSPHRLSGTLRIGGQEQFYLEGQVSLAIPGEDDMTVHTSSQHPSEVQHLIAHALNMSVASVTVEVGPMGSDRRARCRQDRPTVQDAARSRRRHGHDRQASRFPRGFRGRLRR
jgi:xanthine dehydrogenase large subunit